MKDLPGLYLHVPFCRTKCPYCDFFSVTSDSRAEDMVEAMIVELEYRASAMEPFDTIYVGGGTPSSLEPALLAKLLEGAKRHLLLDARCEPEITVEVNPADVDEHLLETLEAAGANRISLGVQSFSDDNLSTLGRRHDRIKALHAVESIKQRAFATLGIDLIYGIPACPASVWREDLQQALSLEPEHLSCYALTVAPNTPFGRDMALGIRSFPNDDALADLFLETSDLLSSYGYIHYEVSNFALGEKHKSRHNTKYWNRSPYTGIGPSAHSFDQARRWWNISNVDSYCEEVGKTSTAQMGEETIGPQQAYMEQVALGMRTSSGVSLELLRSHGVQDDTLKRFADMGLAEIKDGRILPTVRGYLMADSIASALT